MANTNQGKISSFGGPSDSGVKKLEGLALYARTDRDPFKLFLPGGMGMARGLNPKALYCAMRWNYLRQGSPRIIRATLVRVLNPRTGQKVYLHPTDWGPGEQTGRLIDVSPEALAQLGARTDDTVEVTWLPDATQAEL